MRQIENVKVTSIATLDELYKESALTIIGLAVESIPDFVEWVESFTELINRRVYIVSGETMNSYCGNTGNNAYANDLNLVAIKLSDMKNYEKIVMPRFTVGGRWFDDIVDNNRRREYD